MSTNHVRPSPASGRTSRVSAGVLKLRSDVECRDVTSLPSIELTRETLVGLRSDIERKWEQVEQAKENVFCARDLFIFELDVVLVLISAWASIEVFGQPRIAVMLAIAGVLLGATSFMRRTRSNAKRHNKLRREFHRMVYQRSKLCDQLLARYCQLTSEASEELHRVGTRMMQHAERLAESHRLEFSSGVTAGTFKN